VAIAIQALDSKRTELIRQSTPEAWRHARAAAIVYHACMMRIPGKGPAYRDEMMAAYLEWLATEVHPGEKIVIRSDHDHVRSGDAPDHRKSMGVRLREPYGNGIYVVGFASGDSILSLAGRPSVFLNLAGVPIDSPLGRWRAQRHLFHNAGAETAVLPKLHDGLIFVDQGHATRALGPQP